MALRMGAEEMPSAYPERAFRHPLRRSRQQAPSQAYLDDMSLVR